MKNLKIFILLHVIHGEKYLYTADNLFRSFSFLMMFIVFLLKHRKLLTTISGQTAMTFIRQVTLVIGIMSVD